MINDMILADAFRPEFLARFDIKAPVRIPKSFHTDPDKPYHIPCIEMPVELQDLLDYEGKIDRGPDNINRLIAEGEKAATRFLQSAPLPSPPHHCAKTRRRDNRRRRNLKQRKRLQLKTAGAGVPALLCPRRGLPVEIWTSVGSTCFVASS